MNVGSPHKHTLRILLVALSLVAANQPAVAHMMVAQHGTLNIVEDGAYLVVSLPVSAFEDVDTDRDQKLSAAEFSLSRRSIVEQITRGILLSNDKGPCPLQGIMLSLAEEHEDPSEDASHVIVMGRFALNHSFRNLRLTVNLFGHGPAEKQLKFSAKRNAKSQQDRFELSPGKPAHWLFLAP